MRFRTPRARARAAAAATVAAALLCGAPAAGAADRWPPGGTADGVRITQRDGASAIVFEQRASGLYRTIAGKRVTVACTKLHDVRWSGGSGSSGAMTDLVAPKTRRPLRIGGLQRGADYCRVSLPKRTIRHRGGRGTIGPRPVVAIALTERGAVYLDEEAAAMTLDLVLTVASSLADDGGFASSARVVRFFGRAGGAAPIEVVALGNPADVPPAGKVGYNRGGRDHAAAVMLAANGRRLFLELLPDDELRTNVLGYINRSGEGIE